MIDTPGVVPNSLFTLSGNVSVNLQGALYFISLGSYGLNLNGHTVSVCDNFNDLLVLAVIPASCIAVNAWGGPVLLSQDAVTTADFARDIAELLKNFSLNGHQLIISDTALMLINPVSPPGIALATEVEVSGPATLTAAQATQLMAIGPKLVLRPTAPITISDSVGAILAMSPLVAQRAAQVIINSTTTQGNAVTLSALHLISLVNTPNFAPAGLSYNVDDTATSLAQLEQTILSAPSSPAWQAAARLIHMQLSANGTVSASQANLLADIPGLDLGNHTLGVSDTAANLATLSSAARQLATGIVNPSAFTFGGNVSVNLQGALYFISLGSYGLNLNGHTVSVCDNFNDLLVLAVIPASCIAVNAWGGPVLLSQDAVTTADFARDIAELLKNFSLNGHQLIISDTALMLINPVSPPGIALATEVEVSGPATLTAAQATQLMAIGPKLVLRPTAPITISDSVGAILAMSPLVAQRAAQVIINSTTTQGNAVTLSALHLISLVNTPNFAPAGLSYNVDDTATSLAQLEQTILSAPSSPAWQAAARLIHMQLSANGTVSASQANLLADIPGLDLGNHTLGVSDTAANLATLSSAARQLATGIVNPSAFTFGGNVSVNLQGALYFISLGSYGLNLNGHTVSVCDNFNDLLVLAVIPASCIAVNAWGGPVLLSQDAVTTADFARDIAELKNFSLNGHQLIISDTALMLINPVSPPGIALATEVEVSGPATLTAAQATQLMAIGPKLVIPPASPITISDSLSALQLISLMNARNFAPAGLSFNVSDTATSLAQLEQTILSAPSGPAWQTAVDQSHIRLSADGIVSASQANLLADLPGLDLGNHTLVVSDTAANLATLSNAAQRLVTSISSLTSTDGNGAIGVTNANVLQLWFAPPAPSSVGGPQPGNPSTDYADLFTSSSKLAVNGQGTAIFSVPLWYLEHVGSSELEHVFSFLNANNIKLGLGDGVLPIQEDGAGRGIEGYNNVNELYAVAQYVASLGGHLDYLDMDGPLYSGHELIAPGAEEASIDEVAQQAATTVTLLRTVFPDMQVTDTEPVTVAPDLAAFESAFEQDAGLTLAGAHADSAWSSVSGLDQLNAFAASAASVNVPFGVYVLGFGSSNQSWVRSAEMNLGEALADRSIEPDQIIVASWDTYPTLVASESDPASLSHVRLAAELLLPLYQGGSITGEDPSGVGIAVAGTGEPAPSDDGTSIVGIQLEGSPEAEGSFALIVSSTAGSLSVPNTSGAAVAGSGTGTILLSGDIGEIDNALASLTASGTPSQATTIDASLYGARGLLADTQIGLGTTMSGDDGAGPLKNVSFLYFDSIDGALTATPHPTEFVVPSDGSGNEVITGFRAALDIIDVPLSMASSFATIESEISPTPQGASIRLSPALTLLLAGTPANQLTDANFALG